jgi:small multidrug resistance family-3 protein
VGHAQLRIDDLAGAGLALLVLFAWLLTRADVVFAGRAHTVYGDIYIVASLIWLRDIEGHAPERWDIIGGVVVIAGATIILCAPRAT